MQPSLGLIPTVQEAIAQLLTTYEPEFLRFGRQLFLAFAAIVIAWRGIHMMLSHEGLGEQMRESPRRLEPRRGRSRSCRERISNRSTFAFNRSIRSCQSQPLC
jgi:hypothetical protein